MEVRIENGIAPRGRVILPPSKSEAIRACLLLSLAGEAPERALSGYEPPFCGDVKNALAAFKTPVPDAGESAALLRMLVPVLLETRGEAYVKASPRLLERGIWELESCLGAAALTGGGALYMRADLKRDSFQIDCSRSSQFFSGLILALAGSGRECTIRARGMVSAPYAELTLRMARDFDAKIEREGELYRILPAKYRVPASIDIAPDRSAAAVFEAMELFGASLELPPGGGDQADAAFKSLASRDVVSVRDNPDLTPLLAVAACAKRGITRILDTARLKTKESDRESGTVKLINDLGGIARTIENGIEIEGRGGLKGGIADPASDHRMAFAAAAAAMLCSEPVIIPNAECVNKSFPGFFETLKGLCEDGEIEIMNGE